MNRALLDRASLIILTGEMSVKTAPRIHLPETFTETDPQAARRKEALTEQDIARLHQARRERERKAGRGL